MLLMKTTTTIDNLRRRLRELRSSGELSGDAKNHIDNSIEELNSAHIEEIKERRGSIEV